MPVLNLKWINESIEHAPDGLMAAPIRQLTSSPLLSWGVYCEQIYASTDGRRVAFLRQDAAKAELAQMWVADLDSHEVACVGPSAQTLIASTPYMDSIYYVRPEGGDGRVLTRLNLRTLELDDMFTFSDKCPVGGTPGVSTDERWFVAHRHLHDGIYGMFRIDLKHSRWECFHEEKDICNTHVQFEPTEGRDLLIQHNRGHWAVKQSGGKGLCGPEGAALYVIDIDGRNRRNLPLGAPWTGPVDGHQCWIGRTKKVLAVVGDELATGSLAVVTPGDAQAQRIMPGFGFIHVSAAADGDLIAADHRGQTRVYLGSLATGKAVHFCEAVCSRQGGHESWEEPYIVSGNRHVIFNSERSGHAELFAAEIPPHVLAYLKAGV